VVAAIVVQARMTSTRLPGKTLMPILGRPMLAYQIDRLTQSLRAQLCIATTWDDADDPIADLCVQMDVACVRGHPTDLLSRNLAAANFMGAEMIGLGGADDPLLDAEVFDTCFDRFAQGGAGIVHSRGWPLGLNAHIVSRKGLKDGYLEATDDDEREHTLPWFERRPERYPSVEIDEPVGFNRPYRFTVDEAADFEMHRTLIEYLYPRQPDMPIRDIIEVLDEHPEWAAINASIRQYWWAGAQERVAHG
jgi:spore coat polysaccharide biosynthesis protein SpsF